MARMFSLIGVLALAAGPMAGAEFAYEDNGTTLWITEAGEPVLGYNHGTIEPEDADTDFQEQYRRSSYIHPLFGLDGDVLTEDFPDDHPHHRGVFWSWPGVQYGDQGVDVWHLAGVRQLFEEWVEKEVREDSVLVHVRNGWRLTDEEEPFIREDIRFTVHPADDIGRAIDFELTFTNVSQEDVALAGGYGGFNVRPDSARPDEQIAGAPGLLEDSNNADTPWADYSSRVEAEGPYSGTSIFQHPDNPDYPHDGWTLRHYGFLGQAWPQDDPYVLQPGGDVTLEYRLYVHRGDAEEGEVAERFEAYLSERQSD